MNWTGLLAGVRRRRGATGTEYALILGLVAATALISIAASGQRIGDIMDRVSNALGVSVPQAQRAALAISPSDSSDTVLIAAGPPPALGTPIPFTLTSTGEGATGPLNVQLSGSGFAIAEDGCTGRSLAPAETCTVSVQPRASVNGALNALLTVADRSGAEATATLSGSASGFLASLVLDNAPLAVSLTGSSPGACTAYAVQNNGTVPLSGLAASFAGADAAHFRSCTPADSPCSGSLAAGSGCNMGVQLLSATNGSFAGTVTVSSGEGASASRDLQGTASGLQAALILAWATDPPSAAVGASSGCVGIRVSDTAATAATLTDVQLVQPASDYRLCQPAATPCGALPANLAAHASCLLGVEFQPSAEGASTATLTATFVAEGAQSAQTQDFAIAGTGLGNGDYTLSWRDENAEQPADGSDLTVSGPGDPATGEARPVTLYNAGPATTDALRVAIAGSGFGIVDNDCQNRTLAADTFCTVLVAARASGEGALTGQLRATYGAQTLPLALTGTASDWPATLAWFAANGTGAPSGSNMNVAGSDGTASGTARTFVLTNTGSGAASPLVLGFDDATYFQIASTDCTGSLAAHASCSVSVRPVAAGNATLRGKLLASWGTDEEAQSVSVKLTGTASGWWQELAWQDAAGDRDADGSGFDIANGAGTGTLDGTPRTFTLKDVGSGDTSPISVTLTDGANFRLTNNGCAGTVLSVGTACAVTVIPSASAEGDMASILRAQASGPAADLDLEGTASGWAASLIWRSNGGGTPTTGSFSANGAAGGTVKGTTYTYRLTNRGRGLSQPVTVSLSDATHFRIGNNSCGAALAYNKYCTVQVTFYGSGDGTFTADLMAVQGEAGTPLVLSLSGTASGWPVVMRWLDPDTLQPAVGTGFLVDNSAHVTGEVLGTSRTVLLQNSGQGTRTLSPVLSSTSNFTIADTDCRGTPLPPGGSCRVTVTAKASKDSDALRSSLYVTVDGAKVALTLAGSASGWPSGLSWYNANDNGSATGNQSAFNLNGSRGGQIYGAAVTYYLHNIGPGNATGIAVALDDSTHFELVTNDCGAALKINVSCSLTVRAKAKGDGAFAANLTASQAGFAPVVLALKGSGANWPTGIVWLDAVTQEPADGTGMAIANGDRATGTHYGATRNFLVSNYGEGTLSGTVSLQSSSYFEILTDGCSGIQIGPQGTCPVSVRAKASRDWDSIATNLRFYANSTYYNLPLSGSATGWPPTLSWRNTANSGGASGNPSVFRISGTSGGTQYGTYVFTLWNQGPGAASGVAISLADTTHFEIVSNGCASAVPYNGTCTVGVRVKLWGDGTFTSVLTAAQDRNFLPLSLTLTGTGSNWPLDMRWLDATGAVAADGSGLNIDNAAHETGTQPGPARTFVLKNFGEGTANGTVSLASSTNFQIDSTDCGSVDLGPQQSCSVTVHPTAYRDLDSISSTLRYYVRSAYVTLPLSGSTTGWRPTLAWYNSANSGGASGSLSNFTLSGASGGTVTGTTYTYTLRNTYYGTAHIVGIGLSDTAHFSVVSDGCTGAVLAYTETCPVGVNARASGDGSFTATLTATQDRGFDPVSLGLSGSGANWPIDMRWLDVTGAAPADGSGMTVNNATHAAGTQSGTARTFVLKNFGEGTANGTVSLLSSTNFAFGSNNCSSVDLGPQQSCTVTVYPQATRDYDSISTTLRYYVRSAYTNLALSGSTTGWTPVLAWYNTANNGSASGSPSNFTLNGSGGGTVTGTTYTYTLRSTSYGTARVTGIALSDSSHFSTVSDSCTGVALAMNATCSVGIAAKTWGDGTFTATLSASQDRNFDGISLGLSGSGANWPLDLRWLDAAGSAAANGSGIDTVNASHVTTTPLSGSARTFTLKNFGEGTANLSSVSVSPTTNFTLATTCTNADLGPGQSCTVTATARASGDGPYSANLNVSGETVSALPLSGTASGWPAALAWRNATNTSSSASGTGMTVNGSTVTSRDFALYNTGKGPATDIVISLSSGTNFVIVANNCSSPLAPATSCTITVQSRATANSSSFSAVLTGHPSLGTDATLTLQGSASGL